MKIQRKWRRAWQRGKKSYYKGWWLRQKQQKSIAAAQCKRERNKFLGRYASWAPSAVAAATVLTFMGIGMPVAFAANNDITTTGKTATTVTDVNDHVTKITTGTISGVNGINSFDQFNVSAGKTVNLVLPSNTTNLINLVSGGQSQLNGVLNSIKDNKIGGNVFFLNPSGMIVGATSTINTGSLAIYTPSQTFVDNFNYYLGNPSDSNYASRMDQYTSYAINGTWPQFGSSGLITVEGTINTTDGVKFGAGSHYSSTGTTITSTGKINTGAYFNTGGSTAADLFDNVVNVHAWGSGQTIAKTDADGSIEIIWGDFNNNGVLYGGGAKDFGIINTKYQDSSVINTGEIHATDNTSFKVNLQNNSSGSLFQNSGTIQISGADDVLFNVQGVPNTGGLVNSGTIDINQAKTVTFQVQYMANNAGGVISGAEAAGSAFVINAIGNNLVNGGVISLGADNWSINMQPGTYGTVGQFSNTGIIRPVSAKSMIINTNSGFLFDTPGTIDGTNVTGIAAINNPGGVSESTNLINISTPVSDLVNNIAVDGRTDTTFSYSIGTNNAEVTNISTTTVSGVNAVSSFTNFNVAKGNVVNLLVPENAANLINLVSGGQSTINGMLNSVQVMSAMVGAVNGNSIGGNVYFLNPAGMVVGSSGTINAGSLTVYTPPTAFVSNFFTSAYIPDTDAIAQTIGGSLPLNATGTITVAGTVNAAENVILGGSNTVNTGSLNLGAVFVTDGSATSSDGSSLFDVVKNVTDIHSTYFYDVNYWPYAVNMQDGALQISGGSFTNSGSISSAAKLSLTADSNIINAGNITGYSEVAISGNSVSNATGGIIDTYGVDVTANAGDINNQGTIKLANNNSVYASFTASQGKFINSGTVDASGISGRDFTIAARQGIANSGTITVSHTPSPEFPMAASAAFSTAAGDIINSGTLALHAGSVSLDAAAGKVINQGNIIAREATTFQIGSQLENSGGIYRISKDTDNNIVTDSNTITFLTFATGTDGSKVTNISTKTVSGVNALNSFTSFNVAAGNIVNLYIPDTASNLINLVNGGKSTINGIVNSIKDNTIGGNIYFLNPNGLVIGANGAINTGSLTVYTPTAGVMSGFFDSSQKLVAGSLPQVIDGTLAIQTDAASGVITNNGTIQTITGAAFGAVTTTNSGVIQAGAAFSTAGATDRLFDQVVNLNAVGATPVELTGQAGFIDTITGSFTNTGTIGSGGANAFRLQTQTSNLTNRGRILSAASGSVEIITGGFFTNQAVAGQADSGIITVENAKTFVITAGKGMENAGTIMQSAASSGTDSADIQAVEGNITNNGSISLNAADVSLTAANGYIINSGSIDGSGAGALTLTDIGLQNTGHIYVGTDAINNIAIDHQTATALEVKANGSHWVTNVHTNTLEGVNALNSFTYFNVANGNTINLYVPDTASNLINLVNGGKSTINGIVNSIQGGTIGGNVFFLNPSGMVVGAGGSFNVGSLSVYTPTTAFMSSLFDSAGPDTTVLTAVTQASLPIDLASSITLGGTINTLDGVSLGGGSITNSGTIHLGAAFDTTGSASGLYDSVVNTNAGTSATPTGRTGTVETIAGSLTNSGTITSGGASALVITAHEALSNTGTITSTAGADIRGKSIANSGTIDISGTGDVNLSAETGDWVNSGVVEVTASGDVTLHAAGTLKNQAVSGQTNSGRLNINNAKALAITAQTGIDNSGSITKSAAPAGNDTVTIETTAGNLNNSGVLTLDAESVRLAAPAGTLINSGRIDASTAVTSNLDYAALQNTGTIYLISTDAANQIVTDGRTSTLLDIMTVNGTTITSITSNTLTGSNAINSFTAFNVASGNIVNLYVPDTANNLINLVSGGKSTIDGMVNSIHNGTIGGHILFLNPQGLVVGAEGSINAGSLSIYTPAKTVTDTFFDNAKNVNTTLLNETTGGILPLQSGGAITLNGTVNVITGAAFASNSTETNGVVNMGASFSTTGSTAGLFDQVVNANAWGASGLQATNQDASIEILAGSFTNSGRITSGGTDAFRITAEQDLNNSGEMDGRTAGSFDIAYGGRLNNTGHIYGLRSADSSQNIVTDGKTETTVTTGTSGSHAIVDIYTNTQEGVNALNSFTYFNVANGNTVNLYVPDTASNLINLVNGGKSTINGIVNSIQGGTIGGNVFFLNPSGMVVGAGGSFNVGSLSVYTPTTAFMSSLFDSAGPDTTALTAVTQASLPIDLASSITLGGTINTLDGVSLGGGSIANSGTIHLGAAFDTTGSASGLYDSVVNTNAGTSATPTGRTGTVETIAGSLTNSGTITSGGASALVITAHEALSNTGTITSTAGADIRGKSIANSGTIDISGTGDVNLSAETGDWVNSGVVEMTASGDVTLHAAGTLKNQAVSGQTNSGRLNINNAEALAITAQTGIDNSGSITKSAAPAGNDTVTIETTAGNLNNSGVLTLDAESVRLAAPAGTLINSGRIDASTAVTSNLDYAALQNTGTIYLISTDAANQIVTDGRTSTLLDIMTVNGETITSITSNTLTGSNAINSFTAFNVASGNIVNLYVPDTANNLINLVSGGKSTIDGVVNSIHNGTIGGHIFFLNPQGLVVGAEGSINAGSLSIYTPAKTVTDTFFDNAKNVNTTLLNETTVGTLPLQSGGAITLNGTVNVITGAAFASNSTETNGVVNMGASFSTTGSAEGLFDRVVNANAWGTTDLQETNQDASIEILAGSFTNTGRITSGGANTLTVTARQTLTNSGAIDSHGTTTVSGTAVFNSGAVSVTNAEDFSLTAQNGDLVNSGSIQADATGVVSLTAGGMIKNDNGDIAVDTAKTVTITAGTGLENTGSMTKTAASTGADSMTISTAAGNLINSGSMSGAGKILRIAAPAGNIVNKGTIDGRNAETLTLTYGGQLENTGQIYGMKGIDAANNIRTDGNTSTTLIYHSNGTQNITDIYTYSLTGVNALNSFSSFNVSTGNIVNLYVPDSATNLINMVSGSKSTISGVLNSYKDGKIGGNVYFLNPYGLVVGVNGTVNVGSLAVYTPAVSLLPGFQLYNVDISKVLAGTLTIASNGSIAIAGTVNTAGDLKLGAGTVEVQKGAVVNLGTGADELVIAALDNTTIGGNLVANANAVNMKITADDATISGGIQTSGGNFTVTAKDNIAIQDGAVISTRQVASGTALTDQADSGVLSTGDSGNLTLTVDHETYKNKASIDISGAKLLTFANNGHAGGNLSAIASSQDKLYAWAMTGPEARVTVANSLLKGENVTLQAVAKNDATSDLSVEDVNNAANTASLDALKNSSASVGDTLVGTLANLRAGVSVTDVYAKAGVTIADNTKIQADHDVMVSSVATSGVSSMLLSVVGGVTVAFSDAEATTAINSGAEITAGNNVDLLSSTKNKMALTTRPIPAAGGKVPLNVMVTYADMDSNASTAVAAGASINAGGTFNAQSASIKDMSVAASASAGAGFLGLGVAISQSDVEANTNIAGQVSAGNVTVNAKVDTVQNMTYAESSVGDGDPGSGVDLAVDWIANGLMPKVKNLLGCEPGEASVPPSVGITGATAITMSNNTANATITSNGVTKLSDGNLVVNTVQSQGNLALTSDITDTMKTGAIAQQKQREADTVLSQSTEANKKVAGVSAAVIYGQYDNTSKAYIGDNAVVDAKQKLSIDSSITIPFDNSWADIDKLGTNLSNAFLSDNLGLNKAMFTSWAMTSSDAGKGAGSASVDIMNFDNDSEAYIGKNARVNQDTMFNQDQTQNDVSVTAETDVTTLNLSGMLKSPLADLIKAARNSTSPVISGFGAISGGSGIGGSVLVTMENNTTKAYIDSGSKIAAHDLTVDAKTEAKNISIGAAGGKAATVGFNGTVTVNLLNDTTYAYIRAAESKASNDISVNAADTVYTIDAAGAVTESGSTGIGASVAYNMIKRDTQASVSGGTLTAANDVNIKASNDGLIATVSLAGSLTADAESVPAPPAGETDDSDPVSYIRFLFGDDADASNPLTTINDKVSDLSTKDASGQQAQSGLSVAGNVSINMTDEQALAYIGDDSANPAATSVQAGKSSTVAAENNPAIYAISGAVGIAANAAPSSTGIGGAFMLNRVKETTEAYANSASITVDGMATDDVLSFTANNDADILSIAASGGIAPTGSGIAGQVSLNITDNTTSAYLEHSLLQAGNDVAIAAEDQATITAVGGAVAYGGVAGYGASVAVNLIDNTTEAYITNSDITGLSTFSDVNVTAGEDSTIVSVTAAISAGPGTMAGSFSASGNYLHNETEAYIAGSLNGQAAVDTAGDTSVTAKDTTAVHSIAGAAAIAGSGNGLGISASVLVTQNTVQSYIGEATSLATGDLALSAQSDEQVVTIAAGGAGGGLNGIAGSAVTNVLNQSSDAHIGKAALISADGNVSVNAVNTTRVTGLAGAVSIGQTAGVGVGATAEIITSDTDAYIDTIAKVTASDNVIVTASSEENVTSFAGSASGGGKVGIAGAANVHVMNTDTEAYIGREGDAVNQVTTVNADGSVIVSAEDDSTLTMIAGSAAVGGTAGVGASAGVDVITKTTVASIGDYASVQAKGLKNAASVNLGTFDVAYTDYSSSDAVAPSLSTNGYGDIDNQSVTQKRVVQAATGSIKGVAVTASAQNSVRTVAAGAAVSDTVAAGGSAAVTVVDATTSARIGRQADINIGSDAGSEQSVLVAANSDYDQLSVGGALAGSGSVGIGAGAGVSVLNNTTSALIDQGAQVSAAQNIKVKAASNQNIVAVAAALGIGGEAGVAGAVTATVIDSQTHAYIGDKVIAQAGNNIDISADDKTDVVSVDGGAGIGIGAAGVGGSVDVTTLTKDTQAYVGSGAIVDANANQAADKLSVYTGDEDAAGNRLEKNIQGLAVQAASSETVTDVVASGGAGLYAGVAGAVAVNVDQSTTKAFIGDNTKINTNNANASAAQSVSVTAVNDVDLLSVSGAAGGGLVGVSGGVDVGIVKNDTAAYVGNGTNVNAKGSVDILALADKELESYTASLSGGGVGVAGSVSVYAIGANLSSDAVSSLQAQKDDSKADNPQEDTVQQYADKEIQTDRYAALLSHYDNAQIKQAGVELSNKTGGLSVSQDITGTTSVPGGTSAFVGNNAIIKTGGALTVGAKDNLSFQTVSGAGSLGGVALGGAVSVVTAADAANAYIADGAVISAGSAAVNSDLEEQFNATVAAGGAGIVGSIAGAAAVLDDSSRAAAYVGDGNVTVSGTLSVRAEAVHNLNAKVVGASAALLGPALAGSVLSADVTGGTQAYLDGVVSSGGNITVQANTDTTMDGLVIAPSAGAFAGGAAVTNLEDQTPTKAYISGQISSVSGMFTVAAAANSVLNAEAVGVGVGGIGIGAAVSSADIAGQTLAYVADDSQIETASVGISATRMDAALAATTAGAAGVAAVGGSAATATVNSTTQAYTGSDVSITTPGAATVTANAAPRAVAQAKGYNFGGLSVGLSAAKATLKPVVNAHVGSNNQLDSRNLSILATLNRSAAGDSVYAAANASGGGLIGVNATESLAKETAVVVSYIDDEAELNIDGTLRVAATADSKQKADSSANTGGIIAVGANQAEADSNSTTKAYLGANTSVNGKTGSTMSVTANGTDDTSAKAHSGSGGIIAGAAAKAITKATSDTQAYIGSASDKTFVTVDSLSLSAQHTGTVNSFADSLSASVAGASGATANTVETANAAATLNGTINTQNLVVQAVNHLSKPSNGYNADAGAGGLLNGSAAQENSKLTATTLVTIGDGAVIRVTGDKTNPGDTSFEAMTDVVAYGSSRLVAGGVIEISKASADMTVNTQTGVQMKPGADIDSVGDVALAAYTTATLKTNTGVNVWGLAGSAQGSANTSLNAANTVDVESDTKIRTDGDINLYAGRSAGGGVLNASTNLLDVRANTDIYNDTAFPITSDPKADTSVSQTDAITVASGASLRSVGDVNLLTDEGVVVSVGYGYAQDLYRKAAEEAASGISSLFGGGDVSFATEYHSSALPVATKTVQADGTIETGIQNKQLLIIDPVTEGDISSYAYNGTNGNGQAVFTVTTESTEGITYTITKENLASNLIAYRQKLEQLKADYAADAKTVAAYAAEIAYIDSQLADIGLLTDSGAPITNYDVYYLTVNDVKARGGNINITADTLTGSGTLSAPKDSAITIINNSPLYLRLNQLTIDDTGGHVNFNGLEVTSAQDITNRNQDGATANLNISLPQGAEVANVKVTKTVNTLTDASFNGVDTFTVTAGSPVLSTYTMEANPEPVLKIANNYTTTLYSGEHLDTIFTTPPDIQLTDAVTNSGGSVNIYNASGSILMQGDGDSSPNIVANTITITADRGSVYQSYTPGLTSVGGDPSSLWQQSVSGIEDPNNMTPVSTYSNQVNGQGGIIANGNIYISGQYLNINGVVQSGIADWTLTLNADSAYSGTGSLTLSQFIAAKQTEWMNSGKDPNTKYQITGVKGEGVTADSVGTVATYYNPSTEQFELGDVTVQGGRVELYGQILNTGGGSISALDGYGNIAVTNNTNYDLVVNTLNTGSDIHGLVKITDTGKVLTDASGAAHYQVTQYERNSDGQILTTVSHTGMDDVVASTSASASRSVADGYSPVTGTRYVWTMGRDKSITTIDVYDKVSGAWGAADWLVKDSDKISSTTVVGNLQNLTSGSYAVVDPSLENIVLKRTYSNDVISSKLVAQYSYGYSTGFLGCHKHHVTTKVTKTGSTDVYTYSVKADDPIAVGFGGYDTGTLTVSGTGTGNVILNNSLTNKSGSVAVTDSQGSIISTNVDAAITAQSVSLSAGGAGSGIGTSASPVGLTLLNGSGNLTAKVQAGSIYLAGSGDWNLVNVDTSDGNGQYGAVSLSTTGSILQAAAGDSAVIRGNAITLISSGGSIGTMDQALNVNVTGTGDTDSINALAAKDISLRQPDGDFRLGHIESQDGDVRVETANGSLIDANPIATVDTRTVDEINALWDRMLVKQGSGAETASNQALTAYANSKQTAYFAYWSMRHVTPAYDENGKVTDYTADAYNPSYTYTATDSDKVMFQQTGMTSEQQQQYVDQKTQKYLSVGQELGADAVYNANYTYTISDADRASLTTKGWTDSQLKYSVDLNVAKQTVSTDTTLQDPNVIGNHVKLIAKNGGIGIDNGELVLNPNDPDLFKDITNADGTVTPSAARLALASAEGDDISVDADNNVHIALRKAIYVQSDTLEAEGLDHVYIGSTSPIYVKSIKSGSGIDGVYDGSIRIKGKAGLYDVSTAEKATQQGVNGGEYLTDEQAALQGGRTVIEAGYGGSLGTSAVPFSVRLAERAALTARAAGNVYIDSVSSDLYLAEIYSENDVWLHSTGSILTNTDAAVNSVATEGNTVTLLADAGTLGAAGHALLVDCDELIVKGQEAVLQGQVANSLELNVNQLTVDNLYSIGTGSLQFSLAGYGKDSADSAAITLTGGNSVVFNALNADNTVITAYNTNNLSFYHTTIGNLATFTNKYFTTIAGPALDPSLLQNCDLALKPQQNTSFYLTMLGSQADTDAMVLLAGDNIRLASGAKDHDTSSMVNRAMKTNADILRASNFLPNFTGVETTDISGGISSNLIQGGIGTGIDSVMQMEPLIGGVFTTQSENQNSQEPEQNAQ